MKRITSILKEETIATGLQAADKEEALTDLVELTEIAPGQKEAVREAIFEREQIISTGVGKGIAIPHCKVGVLNNHYCSLAILAEPIAFDSVDDIPAQILFLLASPKVDKGQHLRLISSISRILNDQQFRDKLLKLKSSKAVLNALHQEELKK